MPLVVRDGEHFENLTMDIDGYDFIDCHFVNCILVYNGGEIHFARYHFDNVRFVLSGAAARTAEVVRFFGLKVEGEFAETGPQIVQ